MKTASKCYKKDKKNKKHGLLLIVKEKSDNKG